MGATENSHGLNPVENSAFMRVSRFTAVDYSASFGDILQQCCRKPFNVVAVSDRYHYRTQKQKRQHRLLGAMRRISRSCLGSAPMSIRALRSQTRSMPARQTGRRHAHAASFQSFRTRRTRSTSRVSLQKPSMAGVPASSTSSASSSAGLAMRENKVELHSNRRARASIP